MNLIKWIVAIAITACVYPLVLALMGYVLWVSIIAVPFYFIAKWIKGHLD